MNESYKENWVKIKNEAEMQEKGILNGISITSYEGFLNFYNEVNILDKKCKMAFKELETDEQRVEWSSFMEHTLEYVDFLKKMLFVINREFETNPSYDNFTNDLENIRVLVAFNNLEYEIEKRKEKYGENDEKYILLNSKKSQYTSKLHNAQEYMMNLAKAQKDNEKTEKVNYTNSEKKLFVINSTEFLNMRDEEKIELLEYKLDNILKEDPIQPWPVLYNGKKVLIEKSYVKLFTNYQALLKNLKAKEELSFLGNDSETNSFTENLGAEIRKFMSQIESNNDSGNKEVEENLANEIQNFSNQMNKASEEYEKKTYQIREILNKIKDLINEAQNLDKEQVVTVALPNNIITIVPKDKKEEYDRLLVEYNSCLEKMDSMHNKLAKHMDKDSVIKNIRFLFKYGNGSEETKQQIIEQYKLLFKINIYSNCQKVITTTDMLRIGGIFNHQFEYYLNCSLDAIGFAKDKRYTDEDKRAFLLACGDKVSEALEIVEGYEKKLDEVKTISGNMQAIISEVKMDSVSDSNIDGLDSQDLLDVSEENAPIETTFAQEADITENTKDNQKEEKNTFLSCILSTIKDPKKKKEVLDNLKKQGQEMLDNMKQARIAKKEARKIEKQRPGDSKLGMHQKIKARAKRICTVLAFGGMMTVTASSSTACTVANGALNGAIIQSTIKNEDNTDSKLDTIVQKITANLSNKNLDQIEEEVYNRSDTNEIIEEITSQRENIVSNNPGIEINESSTNEIEESIPSKEEDNLDFNQDDVDNTTVGFDDVYFGGSFALNDTDNPEDEVHIYTDYERGGKNDNPDSTYFENDKERVITGISYEYNGTIVFVSDEDPERDAKVAAMVANGAKPVRVRSSLKENYGNEAQVGWEGYFNIEDIDLGGPTK